nr:MAG TPA: 4-deoxy-L-threo-5-hexosulose-uronate ketol-isomerase [Caudoviricetes sp.]
MGLSYSPHTHPEMYLHLLVRVVSFILHLCIQVDLHRTLVPTWA